MHAYLQAENSFLRTVGNRCLLLIFLCALTRSGGATGEISGLGVKIDLSQGLIIVATPILALLLVLSLRLESANLALLRADIAADLKKKAPKSKSSWLPYLLFFLPTAAVLFLIVQFYAELVPAAEECTVFNRYRYLWDFSLAGVPSKFCLGTGNNSSPWIYAPPQLYAYVAIAAACGYFGYAMAADWRRDR